MSRLLVPIFILLMISPALSQQPECLRVMPAKELVLQSFYIGRVKVLRISPSKFHGNYGQMAILRPLETVSGDTSLKEIQVLAKSNIQCAKDIYKPGQEMLVFLILDTGLFTTLNYQYGMFQTSNGVVKGWRSADGNTADKPFPEVRKEIEGLIAEIKGLKKRTESQAVK